MIKVGLCGTIGSGKSTVCRLFADRGVAIYVADDRAKELMNTSQPLKEQIVEAFGAQSYIDGALNRPYLASMIFNNDQNRLLLNSIVHPAVCADFVKWAMEQKGNYVIVESAILFESGLDNVVDTTIAVVAPKKIALARAAARDGVSEAEIEKRMAVQMRPECLKCRCDFCINNIDLERVKAQVEKIDFFLSNR